MDTMDIQIFFLSQRHDNNNSLLQNMLHYKLTTLPMKSMKNV